MKFNGIILYSNNLKKTTSFYVDTLGFTVESKNDSYITLTTQDGTTVGIKKASQAREIPGAQTFILEVSSIDDLYEKYTGAGLDNLAAFLNEPWGKTFSMLDPDGNKIEFIQEQTQKATNDPQETKGATDNA